MTPSYHVNKPREIGIKRLLQGDETVNTLQIQALATDLLEKERDRARKIAGILSQQVLKNQNAAFANTMGVSANNRGAGFAPAS